MKKSVLLWAGWIFAASATVSAETFQPSDNGWIRIFTPHYSLVCSDKFPIIASLSIDSGGPSRRVHDQNLLKPGWGATPVFDAELPFAAACDAEVTPHSVAYRNIPFEGAPRDFIVRADVQNPNVFQVEIASEQPLEGEVFRIGTSPAMSPPTLWAQRATHEPSARYNQPRSPFSPRVQAYSWQLPAVVHFPDFGLLRIEADRPEVYLQEHIVPGYENSGVNMTPNTYGWQAAMNAYHHGTIFLSFHTPEPAEKVSLTFTVQEEHYPQVEGCDFSGDRWRGFRRCWMNAFPVNPRQHCMGDNILLDGISHLAMGYKADMIVFTPAIPGANDSPIDAIRRALEATFSSRVEADGRVKGYGLETSQVSLITLYDYLLTTNDWSLVQNHLPAIRNVAQWIIRQDKDGDGILEDPSTGRDMKGVNGVVWWDYLAIGHKNTWTTQLAYRALRQMRSVFDKLGEEDQVAAIDEWMRRVRENFHQTFYNPETGVYAAWVDVDGKKHDYYFTFPTAMAINEGLVEKAQGQKMMQILLTRLGEQGFCPFTYGVPASAMPIAETDMGDWEPMSRWGNYMNGGLCGMVAYHFIQALYNADLREEADQILFTMIDTFEREPTHSGVYPGYFKSVDWRTPGGAPCGYNYLADNYYFLLAAITGHYGVPFPALSDPPAPASQPATDQ